MLSLRDPSLVENLDDGINVRVQVQAESDQLTGPRCERGLLINCVNSVVRMPCATQLVPPGVYLIAACIVTSHFNSNMVIR